MEKTIEMPNLIDVPMETSEKLHSLQYLAFELMRLMYTFREVLRYDDMDKEIISIWLRESAEHLDNVNAKIDRIQNQILEIHNIKSN